MKPTICLFLIFTLSLFSCQTEKPAKLPDSLLKLEGNWKFSDSDEYEIWKQQDSVYVGKVIRVTEKDTVIRENLRLIERNSEIFYEAAVNGQNNGHPVLFRLTFSNDTLLIFENPEHDFPKQIEYHFISEEKLTAVVGDSLRHFSIEMEKVW